MTSLAPVYQIVSRFDLGWKLALNEPFLADSREYLDHPKLCFVILSDATQLDNIVGHKGLRNWGF
jgi:hypothetical protein